MHSIQAKPYTLLQPFVGPCSCKRRCKRLACSCTSLPANSRTFDWVFIQGKSAMQRSTDAMDSFASCSSTAAAQYAAPVGDHSVFDDHSFTQCSSITKMLTFWHTKCQRLVLGLSSGLLQGTAPAVPCTVPLTTLGPNITEHGNYSCNLASSRKTIAGVCWHCAVLGKSSLACVTTWTL